MTSNEADGALTLDDPVLHEQMLVTVNTYDVAPVRPVTVHEGVAKVGTGLLHELVDTDPPAGVC